MIWLPYVWAVLSELGLVDVVRQRVMARYGVEIPDQLGAGTETAAAGYMPSSYDPDVDPYYWNQPAEKTSAVGCPAPEAHYRGCGCGT